MVADALEPDDAHVSPSTVAERPTLSHPRSRPAKPHPDALEEILEEEVALRARERHGTHSWRRTDDATRRYLTFLAHHAYTLSDVERRACGLDPLAAGDTG
jgi:hypothetical protein